jgi:rhodanese-related sulfurtransferase
MIPHQIHQRFVGNRPTPPDVKRLSVEKLHEFVANNAGVQVIDVREKDEVEIVSFKSVAFKNLPMSDANHWIEKLEVDFEAPIVCVCHHGVRSMRVASALSKLQY